MRSTQLLGTINNSFLNDCCDYDVLFCMHAELYNKEQYSTEFWEEHTETGISGCPSGEELSTFSTDIFTTHTLLSFLTKYTEHIFKNKCVKK